MANMLKVLSEVIWTKEGFLSNGDRKQRFGMTVNGLG